MIEETSEEGLDWIRSRPESIKKIMRKFPPSCFVEANRPLLCPGPGRIGRVSSYFEDGSLSVTDEINPLYRACCRPEWLTVIGYWNDLTPEKVAQILDIH